MYSLSASGCDTRYDTIRYDRIGAAPTCRTHILHSFSVCGQKWQRNFKAHSVCVCVYFAYLTYHLAQLADKVGWKRSAFNLASCDNGLNYLIRDKSVNHSSNI